MPKPFGRSTSCTLVVASLLALSLVGCRTATTRLASVPGMGWIDRSEKSFGEGWADYEPASTLPPPSATSEPSSTSSGSALAGSASGAESRQSYGGTKPESQRYDAGSAYAGSTYGGSTYGGSTYGGSTNGGSTAGGSSSSATALSGASRKGSDSIGSNAYTPQQGSYGGYAAPNYATSTSNPSANHGSYGYSADSADPSATGVSRYGDYAASGSRNGSSLPSAAPGSSATQPTYNSSSDAAEYTADRNSRFGSRFDGGAPRNSGSESSSLNSAGQPSASTYSPPGFPSANYSRSTPTTSGSESRFGSYQPASPSAADRFTPSRGDSVQSEALTNSPTAGRAAGNVMNNYATSRGTTSPDGARPTASALGGASASGGYDDRTPHSIHDAPGTIRDTQAGNVGPYRSENYGGSMTPSVLPSSPQGGSSRASTAGPSASGSEYADALMQPAPNAFEASDQGSSSSSSGAANGYAQAASEGYGQSQEAIKDYTSASQGAGQNVEPYSTPLGQYPSTSTPNAYLTPSTSPTNPVPTPSSGIQRSSTPWRPGSTGDFQGSEAGQHGSTIQTSYRPSWGTSVAASEQREELTLAVGDRYQFPRPLR